MTLTKSYIYTGGVMKLCVSEGAFHVPDTSLS